MTPRLKSSKKWTAFPKELIDQILSAFEENFKDTLNEAEILVEGRIYPQEILLRVGLLEKGRLKQKNFEVSAEYSSEKENAVQKIFVSVDAAATLLLDYMEKEQSKGEDEIESDIDVPYTWKEMEFEQEKLFIQFSTVNSKLEAEADRLLGLVQGEELYVDEEEDEDFDENASFEDEPPVEPSDDEEDPDQAEAEAEDEAEEAIPSSKRRRGGPGSSTLH